MQLTLKKVTLYLSTLLVSVGLLGTAMAQEEGGLPVVMLQETTNRMVNRLKSLEDSDGLGDGTIPTQLILQALEQIVVPHVDFTEMSRRVLGRGYWQGATEQERQEFVNAFRGLVLRTYATAFNAYDDQIVTFGDTEYGNQGRTARVNAQISSAPGAANTIQAFNLEYRLVLRGNQWKVYDLAVEGIGLINNFASQLRPQVQRGGLLSLIASLNERNESVGLERAIQ